MGGDQGMEWTEADIHLVGDAEAAPPLLRAASTPRPASEKIWTSPSMGRTSMNDPMTHYLYNGSG
jgi:hypothetical protein